MIEFDVDMEYLLEEGELDCVVLNDENGEHEPMEFVPKLGSGTCEFTLEYDRDEVERRKKMYEEEPFGLFPQDMPDSAWTCSNCGQQFKCHYDRQTGKLLPVPDWMKCCPSCGFKIRKAVNS